MRCPPCQGGRVKLPSPCSFPSPPPRPKMSTSDLSTQGSFSQHFTSLIHNNGGGGGEQNRSLSARVIILPVQRGQLGQPRGWRSPGLWPTLWPGSEEVCRRRCCSDQAVRSLPLLSPLLPFRGSFPLPLPPPRLPGKFSIRTAGTGRCARCGQGEGRRWNGSG